jgi:phenylalanyl-tRNA synthetase alpha chain
MRIYPGLGDNKIGWAFGIGLERLAMVLFGIPDIRLFWSQDPRFLSQFQDGHIRKFIPFSQYPPCTKDVSFWLRRDAPWAENDLMEVVREAGGDWVESVALVDGFTHPKTGRESRCYRITYRSMERTITNEEINLVQDQVRSRLAQELGLELR